LISRVAIAICAHVDVYRYAKDYGYIFFVLRPATESFYLNAE
jgi:hypothetical protein